MNWTRTGEAPCAREGLIRRVDGAAPSRDAADDGRPGAVDEARETAPREPVHGDLPQPGELSVVVLDQFIVARQLAPDRHVFDAPVRQQVDVAGAAEALAERLQVRVRNPVAARPAIE